jgi:hypothetical protein
MFGIILVSVCTLMHIYVFARAATVPQVKHYLPLRYLIGTGLFMWAVFSFSWILRHHHAGYIANLLEFIGMGWMAVLFLMVVSLLAVDLMTGFGFLFSGIAPSLRGLAIAAAAVLSVLAVIQGTRSPVVQEYTVPLDGLSPEMDGTVIVALSDTHLGTQLGKEWLAERVNQVKNLHPDMVVLVGDILDGHDGAMPELVPVLKRLNAPLGVWAVLGNHEFYRGADKCTRLLESSGIRVLRNQWTEIQPGLIISGIDDLTVGRRIGPIGDFLSKALDKRPPGVTIFLSHTSWEAQRAADSGVGLMLSGHTHGGQIWPFGYLVRRVYPLFQGIYDINGMTVIVSRGAGTWGPRMRLWQPGEILWITLAAKKP